MLNRSAFILVACMALQASLAAQGPAGASQRPESWRYGSEQEWIVSDIVSTLAAITGRARTAPAVGDARTIKPAVWNGAAFVVDDGGMPTTIQMQDHIWAPVNYVGLAKKWTAGRRKPAPSPASEVLSLLTTPRVDVLAGLNAEIGARLAAASPDRGASEDAALLAGVLALREEPGDFGDTRPFLSRMTAFLAVAQSIDAPPTKSGEVAAIVQLALIERQQEVLTRIQRWETPAATPLEHSWSGALRLRATGDWRALKDPAHATLLERLEYVRAVDDRRGHEAALDFLDESHAEKAVDWLRIFEARNLSVEIADSYAENPVELELRDAVTVWTRMSGRPLPDKDPLPVLMDALNAAAPAVPYSQALPVDWPTWAASFQRHLAQHIVTTVTRESRTYGRPDDARSEALSLEKAFGSLALFPVAKRLYALDNAQYADAIKGVIGLLRQRPELLTPANWTEMTTTWNGRSPTGVTPDAVWFTTLAPYGTAQDAANRAWAYRRQGRLVIATLRGLRNSAPYDRYLVEKEMEVRFRDKPPLSEYQTAAGVLAEYDSDLVADLMAIVRDDPEAYVPLARKRCELEVSRCQQLAAYLADHERDDEAAEVYERWVKSDRDRVSVANSSRWLITYYFSHGQVERAIDLADRAADAYSASGLLAKAELLERMGDFKGAEAIQKKVTDRYRSTNALAAFYVRWNKASSDPAIATAADSLLLNIFPDGVSRVDMSKLVDAPRGGLELTAAGVRMTRAGLAAGDVIVAVDGIDVRNDDQFRMAWNMDRAAQVAVIIWREGKYVTVQGLMRDYGATLSVRAYRAPAPSSGR